MTRKVVLARDTLQKTLVNTRQMTSLIDREIALSSNEIKRETVNWVPMWVDWGNTVRSDCGTATAMRAISDKGQLLWYVRHDSKKHGFHSLEDDPFSAIDEAIEAWAKRAVVRVHWAKVVVLSRDLVRGRETLRITMEDAENSALCTLGIDWFRDRMHIAHRENISGRMAGLLMKVEPQLGFVIYEAAQRTGLWAKSDTPSEAFEAEQPLLVSAEQS